MLKLQGMFLGDKQVQRDTVDGGSETTSADRDLIWRYGAGQLDDFAEMELAEWLLRVSSFYGAQELGLGYCRRRLGAPGK